MMYIFIVNIVCIVTANIQVNINQFPSHCYIFNIDHDVNYYIVHVNYKCIPQLYD